MSKLFLVCGLGFGDEGKGTVVDHLVRKHEVPLVVRFNGGGQAAHNVVLPDGRHHTFSQFGSGTFSPGVRTYLSEHVMVNPVTLMREEEALRSAGVTDAFERLAIHPDALVTTRYHVMMNRWREDRRMGARHGSCGMGIGETAKDAAANPAEVVRVRDLWNRPERWRKLERLEALCTEEFGYQLPWHEVDETLCRAYHFLKMGDLDLSGGAVFEGAQGVLLDQDYGFPPHQTYSRCTLANALELLNEEQRETCRKIGVLRTYMTRHGAGPFPTEITDGPREQHNGQHDYAGNFRTGEFDSVLARYAIQASGVDEIAMTHFDTARAVRMACVAYDTPIDALPFVFRKETTRERQAELGRTLARVTPKLKTMAREGESKPAYFERLLERKVSIRSHGPTWKDKVEI